MLTLEFSARLTPIQSATVLKWLELLPQIYNRGLAELEDMDRQCGWYVPKSQSNRVDEKGNPAPYYAAKCDLPWQYYYRSEDDVWVPFTRLHDDRSRWYVKELPMLKVPQPAEVKDSWGWSGGWGYSCPIKVDHRKPLLQRWQLQAKGGLGLVAKGDYWRNPDILAIPYKFRAGTLTTLETPWQEYLKSRMGLSDGPKRGRPKRKRKRDKIRTLIHPNPKGVVVPVGDRLTGIPGLKDISVPGLSKRWVNPGGELPLISTFKLIRRDDRWYVQLTGELIRSFPVKASTKSVGIDPGLRHEFSTSDGQHIPPKKFYRKAEKRIAKLQRAIAHKRTHNLILWLNHPERKIEEIKAIANVKASDAMKLLQAKTEKEIVEIIGGSRLNKLKYGIPHSTRLQALEKRLTKINRKPARQRKAEDEKLTTRLVRNYGAIAVEDGLQSQKLKKKAKPKINADGIGYAKNKAKAKSGLAKSLSDASPGRKIAALERKSKRALRSFKKQPAPYTSKACPVCAPARDFEKWLKAGTANSNLDGDRMYRCSCGWECDRDIHGGVNIELLAFGGRLDLQLSTLAQSARLSSCKFSLTQKKGWKPYWAKDLKKSQWESTRDAVLEQGLANLAHGAGASLEDSRGIRANNGQKLCAVGD